MAATRKSVELFYDVVSPYTWFAFEVLCRYQNRWNIDLKLKPFFLGGIMNGADNKPPAMVPNKGMYMFKEIPLLANYFGVPLKMPKDVADVMFVKGSLSAQRFLTSVDLTTEQKQTENVSKELWNRIWSRNFEEVVLKKGSLSAMRLLTVVDQTCPQFLVPLSMQLWLRIWSRDEDITQPESFKQAGLCAGMSAEQINTCLGMLKDQAVKDRLKQYTEEALQYGAFGSPTIIAHTGKPVMLFGSDRFPVLAQVLGEKWEGPQPGSPDSKL